MAEDKAILGSLERVLEEPVSGIAFVMDYVEFHFNDKVIRALAEPTVWVDGRRFTFPEAGSRDALCSLIGRNAEHVKAQQNIAIEIDFSDSAKVQIPLECGHGLVESAHFMPGNNLPMEIW